MPECAIATGCIDYILPPQDIAQEIAQIASADTNRSGLKVGIYAGSLQNRGGETGTAIRYVAVRLVDFLDV